MKKKLIILAGSVLGFARLMALAQTPPPAPTCFGVAPNTIQSMICAFGEIFNLAIPILIALGIVYFIWGVVTYVIASDEEAKKKGRDKMIFGLIGLLVITAVWALVGILSNTFDVSGEATVTIPTIPY